MFLFNYERAKILAQKWLELTSETEVVVIEKATLTTPYGWIFFYQSKNYIDTNDYRETPVGNCPVLIDRFDGFLRTFGTTFSIEKYPADHEQILSLGRLQMKPEFPPNKL